jgi:uncharacterized protein (DUF58 family)
MILSLRQHLQARYKNWLNKRIPAQRSYILNNRRIFIFLSKAGFAFCFLLILLLLMAVNYQNNMVFALLFFLTLLHSYKNLSGLKIESIRSNNTFVGDSVQVELRFSSPNQSRHYSVLAQWDGSRVDAINVSQKEERRVQLHLRAIARGKFMPPRLLIESFYPFGLYRTWTWLLLDVDALVYPAPLKCPLPPQDYSQGQQEGELIATAGNDDFYGFKRYALGDSLKKVHWPGYAKGQGMYTKEFGTETSRQLTLNLNSFSGDVEARLSSLCYWVIQLKNQPIQFSVTIDNATYGPDNGTAFANALLSSLALYKRTG